MYLGAPSITQSIVSFLVSHSYSPSSNYLMGIGSPPQCPECSGGGNMLWIAWMGEQELWRRIFTFEVCTIVQTSSTCTSIVWRYFLHVIDKSSSGQAEGGNMRGSKGCGTKDPIGVCTITSVIFYHVPVAAQNKGGGSVHPICSADGMTIQTLALSTSGCIYVKVRWWPCSTTICQYPSLISSLEKTMLALSTGNCATVPIARGKTDSNCCILCWGAVVTVFLSTEEISIPKYFKWKCQI